MKTPEFVNSARNAVKVMGLKVQKHSPEILIGVGIVGVVTSTVMACKATTKAGAIIENMKDDMAKIHEVANMPEVEDYTEEDLKKDTTIVYAQTGIKLARLYAPAVAVGAAAITCILASNNIMRKRNVALATAYATVNTSFKEYRGRVVDRFGKELDKELRYNIKAHEIEETTTDKKGKEKTVKKTVTTADPTPGVFTKCFDEYCRGWKKDADYNLMFLRRQQDHANEKLNADGFLFLNDVYEMLGIDKTPTGQYVGWSLKHPQTDGYVDFGIYDIKNEACRDFVNGRERAIWLDFNVDGNILDLI